MTTNLYRPIKNPSSYTFIHTFDSAQEIEDFMKNYNDHPISETYKDLTKSNKDLTVEDVFKGKAMCSSYINFPPLRASLTDQDTHYFVFYSDFNTDSPYYVFDVNVHLSPPSIESNKIYNNRFSDETLLKVLSDKDKKSHLLSLLLSSKTPEKVIKLAQEHYPQYDYKEEINNYLRGKHECFIYPLAKEGDDDIERIKDSEFDEDESECVNKVFYTSCCKHPIKRKSFMDVIRKNKGCPSCKMTIATNASSLRGSLIFDLNDLDFKECYICKKRNAIGFTITKKSSNRQYVCSKHYSSRFDEYTGWYDLRPGKLTVETDIVSDSLVINMDHVLDKMIDRDCYDEDEDDNNEYKDYYDDYVDDDDEDEDDDDEDF